MLVTCILACGCGKTGIQGEPDAGDPEPDAGDPGNDDGFDPVPMCWDVDGDGHDDESCGGDDCDDSDPTMHPGADDVCLDGVDRDCDGIVDGPMLMGHELRVSGSESGESAGIGWPLLWSGSSYVLQWRQGEKHFVTHIDPAATDFLHTIEVERFASFAWSGSTYARVWSESDDVYLDLLSATGAAILDGVALGTDGIQDCPCLAVWTGEHFDLFWVRRDPGRTDVVHARYGETGEELRGGEVITPTGVGETSDFLYFDWTRTATATSIVYSAIHDAGTLDWGIFLVSVEDDVSGLPGAPIRLTTESVDPALPSVVWTGSEYGLMWHRSSLGEIDPRRFARFDGEGVRLQPDATLVRCRNPAARLHWTGSSFATLCVPSAGEAPVISLVLIEEDGSAVHSYELLEDSDESGRFGQQMIWSGSEFGMVWSDIRGGTGEVLFQRIGLCD